MRRQVDVLTLSATPIPRTLSLAISGLRDFSLIQTPPEERRSIRTFTARHDEHLIREAITRELDRGGQAYYVYNRVEGLYEKAAMLTRLIPGIKVGVVHGQLSEGELEKTMLRFVSGETDVLVATSIIESGLDISRANTMIVDRADLFGLSQLYQIRGRVGRSRERAYCYLLLPNEEGVSADAKSRVEVLARHSDLGSGFQIATQDMELRGAGDFLGAEQSGFMTRVGFELFSQMLEEATAELRGEDYSPEIEPELSLDVEALLPEEFIADIGLRLSFYKRYASCGHESDVEELNRELQERFGEPPESARRFMHVMRLKTELKKLRALGLTATGKSATLHLALDTPLKPELLLSALQKQPGRYQLSPDGRIHRRLKQGLASGLEHAEAFIDEMHALI